jgi:hypothetical protein
MLCQLSYGHHATFRFYQQALALQNARPRQEEPKASVSEVDLGPASLDHNPRSRTINEAGVLTTPACDALGSVTVAARFSSGSNIFD